MNPILRFELEGIEQHIAHCLERSNDNINEIIKERLKYLLSEDSIEQCIETATDKAVDSAICELASSQEIKGAIKTYLINQFKHFDID